MIKFKELLGYVEKGSSYIRFEIEGGRNRDSIGDQLWISEDGTEMEFYELSDDDVIEETLGLFEPNSRRAFKGALLRMGVNI